jgi:hypothetical protein
MSKASSFEKVILLPYDEYLRLKQCEKKVEQLLGEKKNLEKSEHKSEKTTAAAAEVENLEGQGVRDEAKASLLPAEIPIKSDPPPEIPILHQSIMHVDPDNQIKQTEFWEKKIKDKCLEPFQMVFVQESSSEKKKDDPLASSSGAGRAAILDDVAAGSRNIIPWYYLGQDFNSDSE